MSTSAQRPSISIVTPSLNQAQFLGEALHSVRKQTYPASEHLVLDGGSGDATPNLLHSFGESHPTHPFAWRSHPDAGQSAALNEGFAQAKGDIIGWLNADDRYRPDCFHHVAHFFANNLHIDILYGDYTFVDTTGHHIALRREIEFSHFILKYHRILYIPTTSTFFRRRIVDDGFRLREDLHYAMDLEFFLRLAGAGFRFGHLPRVLADFRVHDAAKSSRFIDRQRKEHRQIVLASLPLARRIRSPHLRSAAASALQIPAALLRYAEKALRGYYLHNRCESLFLQEQIRGSDPS
jgi:glycosyltransferase involved in cell wall biosynthesis